MRRLLTALLCQIDRVVGSCGEVVEYECFHFERCCTRSSLLDDIHQIRVGIDKRWIDSTLTTVKAICRGVDHVTNSFDFFSTEQVGALLRVYLFPKRPQSIVNLMIASNGFVIM